MKDKNQMYQKESEGILSTSELSEAINCSSSLINQVRKGERNANKGKGKLIKEVDELNVTAYKIAKSTLIEAIEKLIPLN